MDKQQMPNKKDFKQISPLKKIITLLILIFSDFIVVFASFLLAYLVRDNILPRLFGKFGIVSLPSFSYFLKYFYFAGIWIIIFAYEKLYTKRFHFWKEVNVLVKSTTIASSMVMIMIFISRKQLLFSRTVIILALLISLFLFPLSRFLVKNFLVRAKLWTKKLIILGVHKQSLKLLDGINKNKTMGYEVLGFLDDDPQKIGKSYLGVKVLGPISQLEDITKTFHSKDIVISTPHLPRNKIRELLTKCEDLSDSMWLIPRSGDFITEGVEIEVFGDILSLYIKKNLKKPWNILIKIFFDIVLTVVTIIILVPIFLFIALAIKLSSKGPVIFVQKRIGKKGIVFELYKFRSMYMDCEKKLDEHLKQHPEAQEEWSRYKKLKNHDPRVTNVGKLIRKFSLDELPQLYNVLQGKMSLVGPRPYIPEELEDKDAFKAKIALVRPGITGLWQIRGRSELSFEERITIDEYYIRNWTLWLDITILIKNLKVWLTQKGAY
jgi:undecaprenyl-phosphate galactose phosphotransferase